MLELGNIAEDATLDFKVGSTDTDGASITLATNGTLAVYKANGTTESTAGVTFTEDFDSLTGVHHVRIDTSADAFYAPGNDYQVVLQGAVVDGATVNAPIARFSIENRRDEAAIDRILLALPAAAPDAAGGLPVSDAGGLDLDTLLARLDAAISTRQATLWAAASSTVNLSGTTIKTASDVETDTQDIQSRLPAALVGGRMDSYVGAIAAGVVTTIQSGLALAAKMLAYFQLALRNDSAIESDLATELGELNADEGSGAGDYDPQTESLQASKVEHDATQTAIAGVQTTADDILEDTGTTIPGTLTAMAGATFDTSTDSLEAIRNRGDAAWTTGAGGGGGSIDYGELAAAIVPLMEGLRFTISVPTLVAGRLSTELVKGEDYTGSRRITVAVTGWTGQDLDAAASITLKATRSDDSVAWAMADPATDAVPGADEGDWTLYFAVANDADGTGELVASADGSQSEYRWGVEVDDGDGLTEWVVPPKQRFKVLSPSE